MNKSSEYSYPNWLRNHLSELPLAEVRYFETIGSTNDHCLSWAKEGAADLSLVVADHQSAGRGRANRRWVTNKGAALAFSLLLRPREGETSFLSFFSPLGAIAIRVTLNKLFGIQSEIKWPNDVLARRKKLAGILVENVWEGSVLKGVILGIGININQAALPPVEQMLYPATYVEAETELPVDRWQLLSLLLAAIIHWRGDLGSEKFFSEWSTHLAFMGERVCVSGNAHPDLSGKLIGINTCGELLIETDDDRCEKIMVGDIRLRAI